MVDQDARRVVVVTGASAGVGRASALLFARRGAAVALLARGEAGLAGAVEEIEKAGGRAIAIPTDMADYAQVVAAAAEVEERLGDIDVWVNNAFASVFSPFTEVSADEFRRVTEVSYLGYVHGTMVALAHMSAREHGTIIQVGSALGARAIPLQSAYCGAKHAINGFTESLRCELMHDHSDVYVSVVQMPAVNTPQFSWVRSRLALHPQPVPPIYQPEVAARAVVFAAEHPTRKQYWVGASTVATLVAQKLMPALLDRYLARTGFAAQQTSEEPPETASNLFEALDGADGRDYGAHGIFDRRAHQHSPALVVSQHAKSVLTGLVGTSVAFAIAYQRRTRSATQATERSHRIAARLPRASA